MPAITKFQDVWLDQKQFPAFAGWLKKCSSNRLAYCSFCCRDFDVSNMGKQSLISHMKGKGHMAAQRATSGQPSIASMFQRPLVPSSAPSSAEDVSVSIDNSMPCTSSITRPSFTPNIEIAKAEILWALKSVDGHLSMRSCQGLHDIFTKMFPDSEIAKDFSMSRAKLAYVIAYGLAPYFQRQIRSMLSDCDDVVIYFDEALNRISQRGQLDVIVRFWDSRLGTVSTRYLNSAFMGHARAVDIAIAFKEAVGTLDLLKILQISMDGPSVNWRFFKDLKTALETDPGTPQIIDTGSCGLHVISGAFQTGHRSSGWNLNSFLRSLYWLFKDSPARRSDFTFITGSKMFPKKFCHIRWTENSSVADRALSMIPSLKKWIKEVTPKPQGKTFLQVKDSVCGDRLIYCKLSFFKCIAELLEPFLVEFQSPKPMFPLLFSRLEDLLRSLMLRVVKQDIYQKAANNSALMSLDLASDANVRSKVDVGFGAAKYLNAPEVTQLDRLQFYSECRKFYVSLIAKVIERSPLKYKMVRASSCLSPYLLKDNPKLCTTRMDGLLQCFVDSNRLSPAVGDKVKLQFSAFIGNRATKDAVKSFKSKTNLDTFYSDVFSRLEGFDDLWKVIRMVLILSRGNASIESGFSVNGDIMVENLSEVSLVAQRVVYDAVRAVGGPLSVPISPEMIKYVKGSRARYRADLEARKSIDAKEAASKESSRKRVEESIEEIESKRRTLMSDVSAYSSQLAELKKKL